MAAALAGRLVPIVKAFSGVLDKWANFTSAVLSVWQSWASAWRQRTCTTCTTTPTRASTRSRCVQMLKARLWLQLSLALNRSKRPAALIPRAVKLRFRLVMEPSPLRTVCMQRRAPNLPKRRVKRVSCVCQSTWWASGWNACSMHAFHDCSAATSVTCDFGGDPQCDGMSAAASYGPPWFLGLAAALVAVRW